jgi:hypothetical protein
MSWPSYAARGFDRLPKKAARTCWRRWRGHSRWTTTGSALTAEEALIVEYGRQLFRRHRVTDDTFQAARARFGDQGVTELTALMG